MAQIKTVQLPVDVWEKLKDLAKREDRPIASYLRSTIGVMHKAYFPDKYPTKRPRSRSSL